MATTRERLAEYAHEAWSGWMKYLFENSNEVGDGCEEIPRPLVTRWQRQMNTPYQDLPPEEQQSDLEEADKMLAILDAEIKQRDRVIERARHALLSIAEWRKGAHEHDEDMGHEPRGFIDDEDWDQVEAWAANAAAEMKP